MTKFSRTLLTAVSALVINVAYTAPSLARGLRAQQIDVHHYVDQNTGFDFYTTDRAPHSSSFEYHGVAFSLYAAPSGRRLPLSEVVRLYNPNHDSYYLTASEGEANSLISQGWEYDDSLGFIGTVSAPGSLQVYRLYNQGSGTHFYTVDTNEVRRRVQRGWEVHSPLGFMYR